MSDAGEPLTERERLVLKQIVAGRGNKDIATFLGCSRRTIEFHVSNILRKCRVASRLELACRVLAQQAESN